MPSRSLIRRRKSQGGTFVLEFALVGGLIFVPLLLYCVVLGLNLGRAIQVTQVSRDAGSMYMRGVDFTLSSNQLAIQQLATGLNMNISTSNSGNGVVILSKVTLLPSSTCSGSTNCNAGQYVLMQKVTVGNSSLRTTNFPTNGTPTFDSSGNVSNYTTDVNARISNFDTNILALQAGEYCYVSEAYFSSPDFDLFGFDSGTGNYSRSIY